MLKDRVIVRIEIGNFYGFASREVMRMRKVGVKKTTAMPLRLLMLMNVQKRRLHKGKRQHHVHQNGDAEPHTHIVPLANRQMLT